MKNKTPILALVLSFFITLAQAPFSWAAESRYLDVPPENEFFPVLEYLNQQGIFLGYEDQTFRMESSINRAELLSAVVRSLDIEPDPIIYSDCFLDVNQQWFAPSVCYAKAQGWIKGYASGEFLPSEFATREEAFKIVLRPFFGDEIDQISPENYAPEKIAGTTMTISDWARPYFSFAQERGVTLFNGDLYHFFNASFLIPAKRGEVADILLRTQLIYEENWSRYTLFLRDHFLVTHGYLSANPQLPECYSIHYEEEKKLIEPFLKEKYGNEIEMYETTYGYAGDVCIESSGNMLFSTSVIIDNEQVRHLTRLSPQGETIKDASVSCPIFKGFEDFLSPHQLSRTQEARDYDLGTHELVEFEFIDCGFLKSGDRVYFSNHLIEGVDLNTFIPLKNTFSKDKNHVYKQNLIDTNLDATTFEFIDNQWAKDKNAVYFIEYGLKYELEGSDPESFEITNDGFVKDKNAVYFGHRFQNQLEGVDSTSFEVLEFDYSQDKDHVFYYEYPLEPTPDLNSFEILDTWLSRDKDHVYYKNLAVEGVDMASFEYLGQSKFKDAYQIYDYGA